MNNQHHTENYSEWYFIPALIVGIITGWLVWGSIAAVIIGAVLGLLTAGFWVNVVQKSEEA